MKIAIVIVIINFIVNIIFLWTDQPTMKWTSTFKTTNVFVFSFKLIAAAIFALIYVVVVLNFTWIISLFNMERRH